MTLWVRFVNHGEAPCQVCKPLDGKVCPVELTGGVIPMHPNCMCAWEWAGEHDQPPGELCPWVPPEDYMLMGSFERIKEGLRESRA